MSLKIPNKSIQMPNLYENINRKEGNDQESA